MMGEKRVPAGRLAIIGGGSSGLVALKHALDELPDWEVVCYEQTNQITGCWGDPYPGFVSTSTKHTTQFACFPEYPAAAAPDGGAGRSEFFRDGEYGAYLNRFADRFDLRRCVRLGARVERFERDPAGRGWRLLVRQLDPHATGGGGGEWRRFDAVIVCSGLHAAPRPLAGAKTLPGDLLARPGGLEQIVNQRVVVVGGGELAVDFANRLARPELNNTVFLSLRSGVRVSPRYHPIRGAPSDFLRNRLLLSLHEDLRNWIGQRFVEFRISQQERMERWFPPAHLQPAAAQTGDADRRRKHWTLKLTQTAKDDLFNMFHNKSDDFLAAVGEQRLMIVGPPLDPDYRECAAYDRDGLVPTRADVVVPAVGRRCSLKELSGGLVALPEFADGCVHTEHAGLYLIGFARPIIGNIPTISEVQARYVVGLISGRVVSAPRAVEDHARRQAELRRRFTQIDLDSIYPVEMFPYCDRLARRMGDHPSLRRLGPRLWIRAQLAPATTLHYLPRAAQQSLDAARAPVYMPPLLIALLLMLKPVDAVYRILKPFQRAAKQG